MKNSRFIYSAVAVLVVGILLNTCFKPKNIRIDQETKDYCLFGQGSYWIYQDSATLKIDSVEVDSVLYEVEISKGDKSEKENYSTDISLYSQDSVRNAGYGLSAGYTCNNSDLYACYFDYDVIYHNGKINESCYYHRNTVLFDEKYNYSINGKMYSKVKIFKKKEYGTENIFYWVKNIGLIRKEKKYTSIVTNTDTSIICNLIKYNVKPYKK